VEADARLSSDGEAVPLTEVSREYALGGSGAGRNRLPIPLTTTPGCMPKNGVSKLIVPSIRWRNGLPIAGVEGFCNATSAANIPPMLCPSKTTSV